MNARIEVLTPVHIGSGEMRIRDVDFVIQENKLVMLDHARMMGGLGHESISDWAVDVAHGKPLKDLLQRFAPGKTALDFQAAAYPLFYKDKNVSQLKTAVRSMDRPYIPGSSLKGAIRTMLLAQVIVGDNLSEQPGSYAFKGSKDKYTFKDGVFQKRVFGSDPNNDVLRFFQVSDAMFGAGSIEVREAYILNERRSEGWHYKKGLAMLYEFIRAGQSAECKVNWADNPFKLGLRNQYFKHQYWQPNGLLDLLQRAHERTGKILLNEIDDWENETDDSIDDTSLAEDYIDMLKSMHGLHGKCDKNREFILRVGGHSGWNFTTGSWIIGRIPNGYAGKEILTALKKNIQKNDYSNPGYIVFPKTRKILAGDLLPGFIKLVLK